MNTGAQASRVVGVAANVTEPVDAGAESVHSPPQSPRLVSEQNLQRQDLEYVEQVPTQLEMFKQLREMQSRLKSAEGALVDCKKELERRSGLKREADGPSGPYERYKGDQGKSKVNIGDRYCWKCRSKHSGECSKATMRCRHCGELGHAVQECKSEVKCFNCKEFGHMSTTCPKAKVELKRGNKKTKTRMS